LIEIKQLTGIYHETQEGSLCAQHALNNLLQREIFSAVSLADIAR
jgi:ataxin-3